MSGIILNNFNPNTYQYANSNNVFKLFLIAYPKIQLSEKCDTLPSEVTELLDLLVHSDMIMYSLYKIYPGNVREIVTYYCNIFTFNLLDLFYNKIIEIKPSEVTFMFNYGCCSVLISLIETSFSILNSMENCDSSEKKILMSQIFEHI